MPNAIKYNVSTETLALKKGNFWIGNGSVGKGPTSSTGYYNGITPPTGGYTIYLNKETGGPSIYVASSDAQLISLTNQIAGQSYTTTQECFNYYYCQNDKVLVNEDYPTDFPYIVLDGLVLYLDAGITLSYPGNGTTWTDVNGLGPKNNGTLTNGPTYNSANGGSIVFDGADDKVTASTSLFDKVNGQEITVSCWIKPSRLENYQVFCTNRNNDATVYNWIFYQHANDGAISFHGAAQYKSNYIPTLNTWVNVTNTVTSSSVSTLYANGTSTFVVNGFSYGGIPSLLGIGADPGGQEAFQGNIAVVQIYNRALTAAEVLQNYNIQKSRFGL
jgi:hypothetical protein